MRLRDLFLIVAVLAGAGLGLFLLLNSELPRDHGVSPVATAQALKPPKPNMFEGRLKSVPTLVQRTQVNRLMIMPSSVAGIQWLEQQLGELRKGGKDQSGRWILAEYYTVLRNATLAYYRMPNSAEHFDKVFREWEAKGQTAPIAYIYKGFVLYAIAANEGAAKQIPNTTPENVDLEVQKRRQRLAAHLAESKSKSASDPGWYMLAIMQYGLQCGAPEELTGILTEALDRFPDYYANYVEAIRSARVCDRPEQLEQFENINAIVMAKTKHFDGNAAYTHFALQIASAYPLAAAVKAKIVDWDRTKLAIDDLLARYPEPYNYNTMAQLACQARDAETSKRLIEKALELPVVSVWFDSDNFEYCWTWAHATARPEHTHFLMP